MRSTIRTMTCVPILLMLAGSPQVFAQSADATGTGTAGGRTSGPMSIMQGMAQSGGMAGIVTHPMANPAIRAFLAAERLSALHTFLSIAPDQEDAWRKFSDAVLEMASTAPNIMALGATDDVFETMDNAATGAKVLAEKVAHARDVLQALRSSLRPEQVKRANEAFVGLRSMLIAQMSSGMQDPCSSAKR